MVIGSTVHLLIVNLIRRLVLLPLSVFTSLLGAQEPAPSSEPELYRLISRDLIQVSVFGEDDVTTNRRIDARGTVNLPLLGAVKISELSVIEAEEFIRQNYIDAEIFIDPQISLAVIEHAPREVLLLGQIASPGKVVLPPERVRISIVELVSTAGGFSRIGKSDGVRVTRKFENGSEEVFVIDVEKLIKGRGDEEDFMVEPGDIVFVPERVF